MCEWHLLPGSRAIRAVRGNGFDFIDGQRSWRAAGHEEKPFLKEITQGSEGCSFDCPISTTRKLPFSIA